MSLCHKETQIKACAYVLVYYAVKAYGSATQITHTTVPQIIISLKNFSLFICCNLWQVVTEGQGLAVEEQEKV